MADAKKIIKVPKLKKLAAPSERPKEEMNGLSENNYYDQRPEFRIEDKDVPAITDWKVGEEYTVVMKVKMEGLRSRLEDGKNKTCGDFRIVSIGVAE